MTVSGYSRQRVLLHWVSAAVIVWTLASGFYVACFDVAAGFKHWVAFFNVSLTTVFIPFFFWRLLIFIFHVLHTGVKDLSFMQGLALIAHAVIYLTVSIVLVTGVLMMDRSIDVFGVIEFPQPLRDPDLIARFFTVHVWACVMLAALIVLHVGAVIVHEIRGHQVLRGMSFRLRGNGLSERLE